MYFIFSALLFNIKRIQELIGKRTQYELYSITSRVNTLKQRLIKKKQIQKINKKLKYIDDTIMKSTE